MSDRLRKVVVVVGVTLGMVGMAQSVGAAPKCDALVRQASLKFVRARLKAATKACTRTPGGTCFNVTSKAIPAKKFKKCAAADFTTIFGSKTPSRAGCTATVTSADQAASYLTCALSREVDCLVATAFVATQPAGCVGSASGAFIDADPSAVGQ